MSFFPDNYEGSWTLRDSVLREGIGLHTGEETKVRLKPSENLGFYLTFSEDLDKKIKLNINQVRNSPLCTKLEFGNKTISTIEHLLAALIGCGLTHAQIEVSGSEIPLLDGSALGWVEAIKEVGIVKAATPKAKAISIEKPLIINRGSSVITAIPAEKFKVIGMIDFPYKAIGQQMFSIELSPENFASEIAPARTFGFVDQIQKLKQDGLIQGGALDNALVCDGDAWLNPPLRFKDEPIRHKILDLIGDLALIGLPKAQVLVYRGSHALHADLASSLLKESS